MVRFLKWVVVTIGILAGLIIGAAVLIPMFVDVKNYLPDIESMVTRQTGRSFSIGDDLELSLFPWAGIRLSDVTLGNPENFEKTPMISVKNFEVRVKVLPLFSKHIQVEKFILDSPSIALVKNKAGQGNWENIGAQADGGSDKSVQTNPGTAQDAPEKTPTDQPVFSIKSLTVERCSVSNGVLTYVDKGSGLSKTVSDVHLDLSGIRLDQAIGIALEANVDGNPVSLTGTAGPLGQNPGAADIDFDLMVKMLDQLNVSLKGRVIKPKTEQAVDMMVDLAPFSPKKLFESLDRSLPIEPSDNSVLEKFSLKAAVKGSAQAVAVSDGILVLDDSTMNFTARAQAFEKPDLKFNLTLDKIDVDRYLPSDTKNDSKQSAPAKDGAPVTSTTPAKSTVKAAKKADPVDYTPLRKLVLDAKVNIGTLKVAGLSMANVTAVLVGKNGVFTLDPCAMDLYQGKAGATARIDVRNKYPATNLHLTTSKIQAGPVVRDSIGKDIIEGALTSDLSLSMTGDTPDLIKQTLGGNGELKFIDGAVVGVDVAGAIRNVGAGLGLAESTAEKPKTDFAEFNVSYTAAKGLVKIPKASLVSPLLRLVANGQTSLVKEDLDFRVEPTLVATIKGQGDTTDRSGLLIPFDVSGTWERPKVRPDLEAILKNKLSNSDELKQLLKGETSDSGEKQDIKDAARGLLKGLLN
nr:AsmA family protein [uncultured Desulfobacter sp.]